MTDIICIGHITLDHIVTPRHEVYMPGGTTFYCAHGISHLLATDKSPHIPTFKLIASLAESEMKAVDDIRKEGIAVDVVKSRESVFFENIYGEDMNNRTQRVRAKADPFTIESLKDIEARYIMLGSLLADDFSIEVVKHLSTKGTLAVDAQGYLRKVEGEDVFPCDWQDKLEFLKHIDILKVNEHEIQVLTGISDYQKAALQLAEWGVKEVLLTLGSEGSIILADGEFHNIPAYPPKTLCDTTGCGDTYVMGYLYKRAQGASIDEAGRFAAAVSSVKIEKSGPYDGTFEEAEKISKG